MSKELYFLILIIVYRNSLKVLNVYVYKLKNSIVYY